MPDILTLPPEWVAQLPQPPEPKKVPGDQPIRIPAELRTEAFRQGMTAVLGIVGGLAIGSWAVEHMFVEGLEDKERRTIMGAGAVALAAYGVVRLMKLDEQWLTVEGTLGKAQEWAQAQAGRTK